MTNVFNTTHKGNLQRSATFVTSRKETLRKTTSHWNGTTQADVCGDRINFLILRHNQGLPVLKMSFWDVHHGFHM